MCLMPSISDSFCSSGVLTSCSTSRALAPAKGTNTLAMVTSICGSSSRGVISTATRPSIRPMMARIGVSGLDWNAAAIRPDSPIRALSAMSGSGDRLALRSERLPGRDRIERDLLACLDAGDDFELIADPATKPHLAQGQAIACGQHVNGAQLAPL